MKNKISSEWIDSVMATIKDVKNDNKQLKKENTELKKEIELLTTELGYRQEIDKTLKSILEKVSK